jgi:hypothetical protein
MSFGLIIPKLIVDRLSEGQNRKNAARAAMLPKRNFSR